MTRVARLGIAVLTVVFAYLHAGTAIAQQQTTISTLSNTAHPWVSSGLLWGWGGEIADGQFTNVYGVGQTFTIPKNAVRLDRFQFFLSGGDNCDTMPFTPCDIQFQMLLAQWNPMLGVMGSILWSQLMTLGPLDAYNQVINSAIIANPLISINPGTYAAMMLPIAPGNSTPAAYTGFVYPSVTWLANIAQINGEVLPPHDMVYPGGTMITYVGAPTFNPSAWASTMDADFSFTATVTTTPEPLTIGLVGTGLLGVGAIRRRRKSLGKTSP